MKLYANVAWLNYVNAFSDMKYKGYTNRKFVTMQQSLLHVVSYKIKNAKHISQMGFLLFMVSYD